MQLHRIWQSGLCGLLIISSSGQAGTLGSAISDYSTAGLSVPSTPGQPDLVDASDSGTSSTDNITNITQPDFTGTAEPGTTITVYLDGNPIGTTYATGSALWFYTPSSPINDGDHTLAVTATGAFNNTSGFSPTLNFTIDTIAPATPSAPQLTAASDSGVSSSDRITMQNQPSFTGSADAGVQITLKLQTVSVGSGTADNAGNWSITTSLALVDSTYVFSAVASDVAGNASGPSATTTVIIDRVSPSVAITRFGEPVDTIHLHFNESVFNLTKANLSLVRDGNTTLSLGGANLNGSGSDFDLSGLAPVTGSGGSLQFSVSGVTDAAGNALPLTTDSWVGSTSSDLRISMVTVPDGPVLVGQTVTYFISIQNDGPADASNVLLLDFPTSNTVFTSSSLSLGTLSLVGNNVQVNLGNMAANSSALVTLVFTATEIGTLANQAGVGPASGDPNTVNNAAFSSTPVSLGAGADLLGAGALLSSKCKVSASGQACTEKLRLTLRNRGNVDSINCSISYLLSADNKRNAGDQVIVTKKIGKVKAGRIVSKSASVKLSGNNTGKFIIAQIDPANLVVESSKFNNDVVIGPLP